MEFRPVFTDEQLALVIHGLALIKYKIEDIDDRVSYIFAHNAISDHINKGQELVFGTFEMILVEKSIDEVHCFTEDQIQLMEDTKDAIETCKSEVLDDMEV